MKRTVIPILLALVAGILVWIPGISIHFASGHGFDAPGLILITILMPVFAYFARKVLLKKTDRVWLASLVMLLGVWLFGPLCMMIAATASGGGFTQPVDWVGLGWMTLLFPLGTWCISTYAGSLGGLVLTTIVLLIKPGIISDRVAL